MPDNKPKPLPELTPAQVEYFFSKIDKRESSECWPWTGSRFVRKNFQYGRLKYRDGANKRTFQAHRMAFKMATGIDPGNKLVCHACDNPPCCNPAHLFLGTNQDNMADKNTKGRAATGLKSGPYTHPEAYPRGEMHGRAKLTEVEAREIKRRGLAGESAMMLSSEFSISISNLKKIIAGSIWKHLSAN